MNKSIPAAFTALTVVFLIGLALTFVFRMEQRRAENLSAREAAFRSVVTNLAEAYREGATPASTSTREVVKPHLEELRGPRVFTVYRYDDGLEYLWTYSPAYIRTGARANVAVPGLPSFSYNDLTEGQVSRSIQGADEETWIVEAIYPLLLGSDFFIPLRDSLIALLAFAAFTLLVTLISARRNARAAYADGTDESEEAPVLSLDPDAAKAPESKRAPFDDIDLDFHKPEIPDDIDWEDQDWEESPQPGPGLEEFDLDLDSVPSEDYAFTGPTDLADDLGEGLEQPSPDGETPIQEPGATETETTHPHGAEREQRTSLARRVGQAIERAAAEDDNLAFAILQYPEHAEIELEELEQTFADAAEAEVVDLMDKRFAALLPRHDLGHALHRLKRLQTERAAEQELPAPSVGLSARNGRLISGDRLINEARVALQRAEREPERIMAFSADPNRFREYIARRR